MIIQFDLLINSSKFMVIAYLFFTFSVRTEKDKAQRHVLSTQGTSDLSLCCVQNKIVVFDTQRMKVSVVKYRY